MASFLLAGAGSVAGPQLSMPPWLTNFPGATAETHATPGLVESNYETSAPAAEVIHHYRSVFADKKLPFHPNADGIGVTIRGAAPECDLLIQIRASETGTAVQVDCAAKSPVSPSASDSVVNPPTTRAGERTEARKRIPDNLAEFDQPLYPRPRAPLPPLVWPRWLVSCDGVPLEPHKGVDRFKLSYLSAEFTSASDRATILAFYADLLNANGYPVWLQSSAITPRDRSTLVEGVHHFDTNPGPNFAMRAALTPVNGLIHVELRITVRK